MYRAIREGKAILRCEVNRPHLFSPFGELLDGPDKSSTPPKDETKRSILAGAGCNSTDSLDLSARLCGVSMSGWEYRANFTIYPKTSEYAPMTISVKLEEYMALILMATPVKSVDISVQRAGGMILDRTPEPLIFNDGGNVKK